jgi:hypothetical protein
MPGSAGFFLFAAVLPGKLASCEIYPYPYFYLLQFCHMQPAGLIQRMMATMILMPIIDRA